MALNTQMSNFAVNTEANALASLFDSGFIDIYDGVQPANADTAITTQNRLVRLTFGSPAFPAAVNGVLTANAITGGVATASGTGSWYRIFKSDGTTVILDGSVGTSNANITLSTTTISAGVTVNCSPFVHSIVKSSTGI